MINLIYRGTLILSSFPEFPWASGQYHGHQKRKVERKPSKIYITAFVSVSVKHELICQWNCITRLPCTCLDKICSCSCWRLLPGPACLFWWNLHNLNQKMEWTWEVSITAGESSFTIWLLMGRFSTNLKKIANELIKQKWQSSLDSKSRKGSGLRSSASKIVW